jgi:hypothetical protein
LFCSEGEEMITYAENVIVYEFNKDKYFHLMDFLKKKDLAAYATENISSEFLMDKARDLANEFFDIEIDGFDGMLVDNISKIVQHIAQNSLTPDFLDFHQRDCYDLDKLAHDLLNTPPLDTDIILTNKFNDSSLHWAFFYKTFDIFMDAYYKSQKRVLAGIRGRGLPSPPEVKPDENRNDILTDEMKKQVFALDNFTCVCCGKKRGRGVALDADHIIPVAMGGKNVISNLQTLCKHCNNVKGINEISYRTTITPLSQPKSKLKLFDITKSDKIENAIARVINEFYHCKAMCKLYFHERKSGEFYYTWEIALYSCNNPEWLETHTGTLLRYIHDWFGWTHVNKIVVKN